MKMAIFIGMADTVYITTDIPEYFRKFGFEKIYPGPDELVEKLKQEKG